MSLRRRLLFLICVGACSGTVASQGLAFAAQEIRQHGNRLTYLEENDPFYAGLNFPKLITPQWVGERGVEAVVILAIDDLRVSQPYEKFLRPILERLKQIDGRAPVSIMVNGLDPADPQLQGWLQEGLSLEVHTLAHPCPLCARSNFVAAAETYHGCVELLNRVPANKPVAFRMPCCDSMNSPSPRFYAEIFNRTTSNGLFLTIDSSVMNITTPRDTALPRELVLDADGREKFRKYLPAQTNAVTRVSLASFVTTIEDYPYPYVIGRLCWEFPAMAPSDWEAFNLHGPTNATTFADWKAALDATVLKQGTFTFIFHPHGWSSPAQFVEFIDYAARRYGRRVKFLDFREAQERLDKNLLAGQPLRDARGQDNGVRLLDLNNDGYLDVVIGNARARKTRVWKPAEKAWLETTFPTEMAGVQFGVLHGDGRTTAIKAAQPAGQASSGAWHFEGDKWVEDKTLLNGLALAGQPILTMDAGRDRGVRLRDIDKDGRCELIVGNDTQNAVFAWSDSDKAWKQQDYALPKGTALVDGEGRDTGLRFVDVDGDGFEDALFSNAERFSLYQFVSKPNKRLSWEYGWTDEIVAARRGDTNSGITEIPVIVRSGPHPNNGAWFHSGSIWVQNEETAHLPDKVDRRSFRQLLTADQPPAKSPAASLAAIEVRPGFKVELVAAEPLVEGPVYFDWGADGKLWVAEMVDYPRGTDDKGKPGGIVRFLEDTDGDGRYDKSTVFLDGLSYPNGLIPWREGVIVSAAPEIFYAADTDGDGRADVRQPFFTGFVEGNPQHRANGFDYGLDNWLYGANGDSGGKIKSTIRKGQSEVNISGRDFRFRPDTGEFEAIAGMTQFGRHCDDWGNWFGDNNPTWLWHFFLPEHYLARNPHLAVKTTKRVLANYEGGTRCFPISRTLQRFNDPWTLNHATSACSPTPYRDDLFGPDFATSVFVAEPVHNLLRREVLEPDGVSFRSRRAPDEEGTEFLRSRDNWFRPVALKTGPDGALYLADMYRFVIEHPEWITPAQQKRLDMRAGSDKGRIYRVYPAGAALRLVPRLDRLDTAGLVAALDSPNGWQRVTAQRLLLHRADHAAVAPLKKLFISASSPKTRLQVLGALEGLNSLLPETITAAFNDPHPTVREHAVRLSEPWLRGERASRLSRSDGDAREYPDGPITAHTAAASGTGGPTVLPFADALLGLADDPSPRVRYQLAFTLGEWADPRAAQALARLAINEAGNADLQTAVLSSAPPHIAPLLAAVVAEAQDQPQHATLTEKLLALATSLGNDDAIARALREIIQPGSARSATWQFAAFAGFLAALDRRELTLEEFAAGKGHELQDAAGRLDGLFAKARRTASDPTAAEPDRLAAVRVLGHTAGAPDQDLEVLAKLLLPQNPIVLQTAALHRLSQGRGPRIADTMLAGWANYSPALRPEVLAALFTRAEWLKALLTRIEEGDISAAQLSAGDQQRLLAHSDKSVRERATRLFAARRSDRQALLQDYSSVSKLSGHASHGAELFRQHCAQCHRFRGEGHEVGIDLAGVASKPVDVLVTAILDPNLNVEWRFVNYIAVSKSDREFSGIIVAETPASITLRAAGGAEETILRSDLKEMVSSKLSLMPEGFEQALKPQDLADLIAYIQNRER
jgi:putative membrane-bound dehydrogenase-like protein